MKIKETHHETMENKVDRRAFKSFKNEPPAVFAALCHHHETRAAFT